jgi:hypothetical protein
MSLNTCNKAMALRPRVSVSCFSKLPVELVEQIISNLNPSDLTSVRLVCRDFHYKSQRFFGRTFFKIVQTDLSRKGLKALQDIAEKEDLRHHVETLVIKAKDSRLELGRGFYWHRLSPGKLDVSALAIGTLRNIVVERFVSCKSFHIYCAQAYDETTMDEKKSISHHDAISIFLQIIAEARLAIKSFVVGTFAARGTGAIAAGGIGVLPAVGSGWVNINKIEMDVFCQEKFRVAWAHLKELILSVELSNSEFNWAYELVTRATNLQILSLGFYNGADAGKFLDLLDSSPQILKLRDLRISRMTVKENKLLRLLRYFSGSLCALSIGCVSIQGEHCNWITILSQLAITLPHLESIAVTKLGELDETQFRFIMFPNIWRNPVVPGTRGRSFEPIFRRRYRNEQRLFGVRYEGTGITAALEMLTNSAEHI